MTEKTMIQFGPHHARLLQNKTKICRKAGIQEYLLERSMKDFCPPAEVTWASNYRKMDPDIGGLCLTGASGGVDVRMMAMCAAFLRNFINARVVTLYSLIEGDSEEYEVPEVLLIPNFYVSTHGKTLTGWMIAKLHDFLMKRMVAGNKTVVYAQSLEQLRMDYGDILYDFIKTHYTIL